MHFYSLKCDFPILLDFLCRVEYFNNLINSCFMRLGNHISNMLASSAVGRGFESRSAQTKYYKIGICYFSAKQTALRRKSKDWFARNLDMRASGATCLSADCCFSELAL